MRINTGRFIVALLVVAAFAVISGRHAFGGALEGVWVAESGETDGQELPEDALKWMRFRFVGDKLFIRGNFEDEREVECTFVIDETKDPKQLDFTPPKEKKPLLGIYERKGKSLRLCISRGDMDKGRPKEFKTAADSGLVLIMFSLEEK